MSLPIADAVTAIFVHDGEIFMTRRHPAMLAFPGYHAFPGGKVDAEDAEGAAFEQPLLATHDRRLMHALARELREELEFDLPAAVVSGLVTGVELCTRALTPTAFPRRFDTWFYVLRLKQRPEFVVDEREAIDWGWAPASAWLAAWHRGELIAAPPTQACLKALNLDLQKPVVRWMTSLTAPPEDRLQKDPTSSAGDAMTVIQSVHGLRQIFVRSNTLPPAEHTNCFVIGDEGAPRIAVDPSPRDAAELARLEQTLHKLGVNQLLITHHHVDHNQFAEVLARRHGWPMLMSAVTRMRVAKRSPTFFDGVDLRLIAEGDEVTRWQTLPVRVLEVPGHDDGQLALMPEGRSWCIVGDLIQGVGTVVISKPEGDMRRYFESMDRVIGLAPRFIFPSHGIGMGTTFRLEETMRHRRMREAEILKLQRAGQTMQEMLAAIYQDLDPRLLPLAMRNIESHLDKLQAEGQLEI
ncbi:MAG: fold metallo-hydrolase [Hydrocarboniphaga sp.]|uniref:MBL fold metallo-hydrolase n=1 Tax=Hydrocarboniphaga sp. TaxID=2033016 RepID=UPI00260ECF8A|nr:MBL fold metallo-hydrolase [Hydrocarboniphaga sp.]MDB5969648.1 fold metallo-hydrolase [Hydrocarboniphaga sp.]